MLRNKRLGFEFWFGYVWLLANAVEAVEVVEVIEGLVWVCSDVG